MKNGNKVVKSNKNIIFFKIFVHSFALKKMSRSCYFSDAIWNCYCLSLFKGTVSVILSDPPCKDCFTTVPLKALSD